MIVILYNTTTYVKNSVTLSSNAQIDKIYEYSNTCSQHMSLKSIHIAESYFK